MSGVFKTAKRNSLLQCNTNIPRDSLSQDVLEAKGKKVRCVSEIAMGQEKESQLLKLRGMRL